ncbi:MAG TPA: nucleotide sugar dehydrogenase [Sedimentisphaerales bacterium]|jgi:UDPglucose 6-dehydrogenase|nr:nucleotide sugar dehydrogenase [Sedimentisphaerales bacterium]HNU27758.1 nucleotide sugar dehydrogenase [Sedimentisphaerales bacterium]
MNISSIGLGKLGLCSAVCFASKGHHVIGVDSDERHIDALAGGGCPIDETGLSSLLAQCRHNMEFTTDFGHAVRNSDITMITVPTPSNPDGRFSNASVEAVLDRIAPAIQAKRDFHIVGVVSTVMPGTCERAFRSRLERLTGKVCGRDFGLLYNPEFVALGSVIHDFLNPDMLLLGVSDDRSAQAARDLYLSVVESSPYYAVMGLTNAEITKLSLNCYVTMKISFANELAAICERIPGADVDVVTTAIGADARVGRKYLKGGLGFGGPCFPRDNLAFQRCAEDAGTCAHLSPRVVEVNGEIVDRLLAMIRERSAPGSTVALLGLSYKPGTHIVEESQSLMLAERLLDAGYVVRMHDPKALPSVSTALQGRGTYCDCPYDAVSDACVVVLLTAWPEYSRLDIGRLEERAKPSGLLIDCWRVYRNTTFRRLEYRAFGTAAQPSAGAVCDPFADLVLPHDLPRTSAPAHPSAQHRVLAGERR